MEGSRPASEEELNCREREWRCFPGEGTVCRDAQQSARARHALGGWGAWQDDMGVGAIGAGQADGPVSGSSQGE